MNTNYSSGKYYKQENDIVDPGQDLKLKLH